MKSVDANNVIKTLLGGGIVILRTDTIYGVIARADDATAVERVYRAKQRQADKPCIVLVPSAASVPTHAELLGSIGEGTPTSVIVPVSDEPDWITRGGDSVAYRVVHTEPLRSILQTVGPVIAPSANPEGQPPARDITQARAYFGDSVDLYVDGGEVPEDTQPSRLVEIRPNGTVQVLR